MEFKQLEALAAVIRLQSFSKAAEELYLTQPTISSHVRSLEQELGTSLLFRTTKEVSPTQEGLVLYDYAIKLIQLRDEAIQSITNQAVKIKGKVSIASSSIPGQYFLPSMMAAFHQLYPDVTFQVSLMDSAQVLDALFSKGCEIGLVGTPYEDSRLSFHSFAKDELVVITPNAPKYERYTDFFPTSQLVREQLILREKGSGTRRATESFLHSLGIQPDSLRISAELNDIESIKRAVEQGLGISIASRYSVQDSEAMGKIRIFPFEGGSFIRDLYLVYREGRPLSPAAQKFVNFTKEGTMFK